MVRVRVRLRLRLRDRDRVRVRDRVKVMVGQRSPRRSQLHTILAQGEPPDAFYIMARGTVVVEESEAGRLGVRVEGLEEASLHRRGEEAPSAWLTHP